MTDSLLMGVAELLVWLESHALVAGGLALALTVPGLVCCWAARRGALVSRQALSRIDERLTHLCSAVELLTDTTESALRTAFTEIERLSQEGGADRGQRAALPQRLKKAARNGRSAREIAQSEGLSEGEVRLQLRLGEDEAGAAGELPALQ